MNDEPKIILKSLIDRYGYSVIENERRCDFYLSYFLRDNPFEKETLINLNLLGYPQQVIDYQAGNNTLSDLSNYVDQISEFYKRNSYSLTWGLDAWSYALGNSSKAHQKIIDAVDSSDKLKSRTSPSDIDIKKALAALKLNTHCEGKSQPETSKPLSRRFIFKTLPIAIIFSVALGFTHTLGPNSLDQNYYPQYGTEINNEHYPIMTMDSQIETMVFASTNTNSAIKEKNTLDSKAYNPPNTLPDKTFLIAKPIFLKPIVTAPPIVMERTEENSNTDRVTNLDKIKDKQHKSSNTKQALFEKNKKLEKDIERFLASINTQAPLKKQPQSSKKETIKAPKKQPASKAKKQARAQTITSRVRQTNKTKQPVPRQRASNTLQAIPLKQLTTQKRASPPLEKPLKRRVVQRRIPKKPAPPSVKPRTTKKPPAKSLPKKRQAATRPQPEPVPKGSNNRSAQKHAQQRTKVVVNSLANFAKASASLKSRMADYNSLDSLVKATGQQVYLKQQLAVKTKIRQLQQGLKRISASYAAQLKQLCQLNRTTVIRSAQKINATHSIKRLLLAQVNRCSRNVSASKVRPELYRAFNVQQTQ